MTDVSTPQAAEETTLEKAPDRVPAVRVVVSYVEGSDLGAALAILDRQVYGAIESVLVVGAEGLEIAGDHERVDTLEAAIAGAASDVEYLWLIQSDARPRPDALNALVSEAERNQASLAGSKVLVAGTPGELESIGGATDVFGEPYSGLDEGEIDLQQYDVVREVAFVSLVSVLVRRDLAQGLRGFDARLSQESASLDFSQRARLAGGRVMIVPSSEVYHQRIGAQRSSWRDQAGRYRAMLKAYRPLTLAWVIPFGLAVGVIGALAGLLTLNWRPLLALAAATGWNLIHLPSTLAERRRAKKVRAVGDEELFRFQARGSIRLRAIGTELGDRLLFMFDDDQALVRGSKRIWASPGIWGAIVAMLVLGFATRSILFNGLPEAGFNFPFEPGTTALGRFFGGWNESGLGSDTPVHPGVGITGLASLLWFGAEGAARTLLTLGLAATGVIGMGRLAGRLGFRGPGRYLAGLVLLAGPGTALATGRGSWLALAGAAVLPWAMRSLFVHRRRERSLAWSNVGAAVFWAIVLGSFAPPLVLLPPALALVWRARGGRRARLLLAAFALLGVVAGLTFVGYDVGWMLDTERRLGVVVPVVWPILIGAATVASVFSRGRSRVLALLGAVVALVSIGVVNAGLGGPGIEEAALIASSFGAALVVSAALNELSSRPLPAIAGIAAAVMLVYSVGLLGDGRLGLAPGNDVERLEFATSLAGEGGPGRVLYISTVRSAVPGEARPGPGYWYRTLDGEGTTLDEVWIPPPADGDDLLDAAIDAISSGSDLRPGSLLAEFAIEWVVLDPAPEYLIEILEAQLDLVPQPLLTGAVVYQNPAAEPLASQGIEIWQRDGADFVGEAASGRTVISANSAEGWGPSVGRSEWRATVSSETGRAKYQATDMRSAMPIVTALIFVGSLLAMGYGRYRT